MEKYLIEVYVPAGGITYDIFIPCELKLSEVKNLIVKMVNELMDSVAVFGENALLCYADSGKVINETLTVQKSLIQHGTKLILI